MLNFPANVITWSLNVLIGYYHSDFVDSTYPRSGTVIANLRMVLISMVGQHDFHLSTAHRASFSM